ncbi:hypothetical protein EI94DRAFT_1739786 [Lactarius quietus]|nr:hypothetical protein EI94DRAFT_1739786 [Lactarius quietus]
MNPPPQLVQWLRQTYPKPSNWLQQCYAWVIEEHGLNPATDMAKIMEHVESQLLMSDLTDSMISGSGLPHDAPTLPKGSLSGPPVLVQILALTEIGHSAFSLMNIRQAKVDRADLSGLARGDNENNDEADEGPVPNYPRSMLQFQISDGTIRLNAIEYKKIPQLDLENTPLGYKMQLNNVTIKHGIAFLEPRTVILKGYGVEDLDANRDNAQHEPDIEQVRDEQPAPPYPHQPRRLGCPGPIPENLPITRPRPINRAVRPPPADSEQLRRPPPPMDFSRQPGPSRQPPGSDYYFRHDDIDAAFLSRAASELERSEATLPRKHLLGPRVVRQRGLRQIASDGSVIDLSAEIVNVGRIPPSQMDNDDDVISIGSDD